LHESYLIKIEAQSNGSAIRYSDWKANPKEVKQVLIINNIGMLAYLYRYADFAWIGGGFGSGIHNTLEAAAFGIPLGFGPRYKKFKEAVDFIDTGAAFSETDATQINKQLQHFVANQENRKAAGKIAAQYIETHKGATKTIIDYCKQKIR
jgi:3-deoxy-D-manno-octulosonic-acid transferase